MQNLRTEVRAQVNRPGAAVLGVNTLCKTHLCRLPGRPACYRCYWAGLAASGSHWDTWAFPSRPLPSSWGCEKVEQLNRPVPGCPLRCWAKRGALGGSSSHRWALWSTDPWTPRPPVTLWGSPSSPMPSLAQKPGPAGLGSLPSESQRSTWQILLSAFIDFFMTLFYVLFHCTVFILRAFQL